MYKQDPIDPNNLKNFKPDVILPGISVSTSPTDYAPIKEMRLVRMTGEKWELMGEVMSAMEKP